MSFTLERVRHELEIRLLTVSAVEDLTPTMRRVTLTGPLERFASAAPDDHVKLIFPFPGKTDIELPELGPQGISRDASRPPMRDYTPRRFDPAAGELVIDIALHGDGPGASWATGAQVGTTVGQIGPRGSAVIDGTPDWYLLAGDETAIPSIARRVEELPAGATVIARIEVEGPEGEQVLAPAAGVDLDLRWLHRGHETPGAPLVEEITSLALPGGSGYAWVAAEASAARALRSHLREERGLPKAATKATGYWKLGASDHHEAPDDA